MVRRRSSSSRCCCCLTASCKRLTHEVANRGPHGNIIIIVVAVVYIISKGGRQSRSRRLQVVDSSTCTSSCTCTCICRVVDTPFLLRTEPTGDLQIGANGIEGKYGNVFHQASQTARRTVHPKGTGAVPFLPVVVNTKRRRRRSRRRRRRRTNWGKRCSSRRRRGRRCHGKW